MYVYTRIIKKLSEAAARTGNYIKEKRGVRDRDRGFY